MQTFINDLVGGGASIAVVLLYHVYLYLLLKQDPQATVQGLNRAVRVEWVRFVMEQETRGILAVQTLRNSTMAATFLASTAVLLMIGTLNLADQPEGFVHTFQRLNLLGSPHPGLWTAKVLLLVVDFFLAFFSFAMSIRLYNHVGYQISLPLDLRSTTATPDTVSAHMNRAGAFYTLGMRAYFFSVPLVFWLFGPHFMLLASLVLVYVLYQNDRAPQTIKRHQAS